MKIPRRRTVHLIPAKRVRMANNLICPQIVRNFNHDQHDFSQEKMISIDARQQRFASRRVHIFMTVAVCALV